jgi:hypothetical protein
MDQMDQKIKSELVRDFCEDTLEKFAGYGAEIIRLDALAYAAVGKAGPSDHNVKDTMGKQRLFS